jgi:molybdate transport system permease protein
MNAAWIALQLSLKIALVSTIIDTILGVSVAYGLSKKRFYGRNVLDTVLTLPVVMPPTVLGYYLLILLGRKGMVGAWLEQHWGIRLIFTWQGAVIATAVTVFPLILKPARAAFEAVDENMEYAAQTLGLSKGAIFFRVILPLAWPSILSGILLAFGRALGEFGATLVVAGSIPGKTQTLSIALYEAIQTGQEETAFILVSIITCTCMLILWLSNYLTRMVSHR